MAAGEGCEAASTESGETGPHWFSIFPNRTEAFFTTAALEVSGSAGVVISA